MLTKTVSTTEQSDTTNVRDSLAINLNAQLFEAMDSKKGTWCDGYDFTEQNDYFDTQFTSSEPVTKSASSAED